MYSQMAGVLNCKTISVGKQEASTNPCRGRQGRFVVVWTYIIINRSVLMNKNRPYVEFRSIQNAFQTDGWTDKLSYRNAKNSKGKRSDPH